jgi:hypothetical protein
LALAAKVLLLIRHHIMLWLGRDNFLSGKCITAEAHEDSIMADRSQRLHLLSCLQQPS